MKIVIVGAGDVGSHLAKMLRAASNDVTVIDSDASRLERLTATTDIAAVCGNPTSIATLQQAGTGTCDLLIAVYPMVDQEVNIVSALLAKSLGAATVTARIRGEEFLSSDNKLRFKEMGLDLMFYPSKIVADEIIDNLSHSYASETFDFAHGKLQMTTFKIEEESPLLEMKLGEFTSLEETDDSRFRIIAIARGEATIIPRFDTKFQYHDLVYAISLRESSDTLMKLFGQNASPVRNVMILGGSSIAEIVARTIGKNGFSVKIIEVDRERCLELSESVGEYASILHGDGRNSDLLLDEGIRECDAFVALTESDETNVLACLAARKFGVDRTIAEVENLEYIHLAEDLGIDTIINKKLVTAGRIFKFTLSGKARTVRYMAGTSAEILEYTAAAGSRITKSALKDAKFPANAIIGGIIRGNDALIAIGDTRIEAYDRVVVFAMPETVREVDEFFVHD